MPRIFLFITPNSESRVNGKPFEDLKELKNFIQGDPDVYVVGSPSIHMGKIQTVSMVFPGDGSNNTFVQKIKISPELINERSVKQDLGLEIVESADEGQTRKKVNSLNTALMLEDGKTAFIKLKGKKNVFFFITAFLSKKTFPPDIQDIQLPYDMEPEDQKSGRYPEYVTLDFHDESLTNVIVYLANITGKVFGIDKSVGDLNPKVTVVSPENISIDKALKIFESVMDEQGFKVIENNPFITRIMLKDALISMEFVNTDIREINNMLSSKSWQKFKIDDSIEGKIDFNTHGEITFDAANDLFQSILESEGFKAVPEGEYIRIIKE